MKINVDNTYNLFFKYFDKKEDSKRKQAAKLCASIAIGVFTLGIYHLVIYRLHRRKIVPYTQTNSVVVTVIGHPVKKENLDLKTSITLPSLTSKEIHQELQEKGIQSPEDALECWKKHLETVNPDTVPGRFQLLKWWQERRIVQTPQMRVRDILKEAALMGIPEAIYQYCMKWERDEALIEMLKSIDSPEAMYYAYLLEPKKTNNTFVVIKEVLLKSTFEEGLYQLFLPGKRSVFNPFLLDNYSPMPLERLLALENAKALFEKGKMLLYPDKRSSILTEEEKSLSPKETVLRGVVYVAESAVKGHKEAIEFMMSLFPLESEERAGWLKLRLEMYHE